MTCYWINKSKGHEPMGWDVREVFDPKFWPLVMCPVQTQSLPRIEFIWIWIPHIFQSVWHTQAEQFHNGTDIQEYNNQSQRVKGEPLRFLLHVLFVRPSRVRATMTPTVCVCVCASRTWMLVAACLLSSPHLVTVSLSVFIFSFPLSLFVSLSNPFSFYIFSVVVPAAALCFTPLRTPR